MSKYQRSFGALAALCRAASVPFLASVLLLTAVAAAPAQDDLTEMVVQFLSDPSADIRALAYEQIRTAAPGEEATKKFAGELPNLPAEGQIGLLSALAQRGDSAAAPAVRDLLAQDPEENVSVAAVFAVGALGDTSDLPLLLEFLGEGSAAEQQAAREGIVHLRGEGLDAALTDSLRESSPELQVPLLEILTTRRELATIPAMLEIAVGENADARMAAMSALGEIGSPEEVPGMVQGVLAAEPGRERAAAEKNIMFVCQNIDDPEQRAAPVLAAMEELSPEDQLVLLSTIGRIGGSDALARVEEAIASEDSATHSAGIGAICNWPDSSVELRLLELARTGEHPNHQRATLRALIRIAPLSDDRTDAHRLDILRTAMAMAQEHDDQVYVLKRASAVRTVDSLLFIAPYIDQDDFREVACEATCDIAHHSDLRDANEDIFHPILDHVIEVSENPVSVDRAQRYKEDRTWVRPK